MSFLYFHQLLLQNETKNRILLKINEIQKLSTTFDLEVDININDFDLSYDEIVEQTNIWEKIAKLSIDLWRDFDYYKEFMFKTQIEDTGYMERLKNLGLVCNDGIWKSYNKPNENSVTTNVFMYYLYRYLSSKVLAMETNINSIICCFCENKMKIIENECSGCSATIAEINEHQLKLDELKNKERQQEISARAEDNQLVNVNNGNLIINDNDSDIFITSSIVGTNSSMLNDVKGQIDLSVDYIRPGGSDTTIDSTTEAPSSGDNIYLGENNEKIKVEDNIDENIRTIAMSLDSTDKGLHWAGVTEEDDGRTLTCGGRSASNEGVPLCHVCVLVRVCRWVSSSGNNTNIDNEVESTRAANTKDNYCDLETYRSSRTNPFPRDRESETVNNWHTCVKCQNVYHMSVDESLSKNDMNWICSECRMKDDSDSRWTDIVDDEHWSCGYCGARNGNGVNVCGGCGIERLGRGSKESGWSCVRCSADNDIEASVCYVCDRERLERGTKEGGWRCASCKTLYPYDKMDCSFCHCSMEDGGRWVCQSCTFENKFVDLTCEACTTDNANVVIKYCQLCKQKIIDLSQKLCAECIYEKNLHSATDWWQCKYKECGIWNDKSQDYCSNCRLSRHNDYNTRGAPCNRWKNGKQYTVWICSMCNNCNDIKATGCGSWTCWATRYGKKVCGACKTQNNGTTNFCSNCTTLL